MSLQSCEGCQSRSQISLKILIIPHSAFAFFSASCVIKSHCGLCCFRTLQVYVPIRQFFYNLIHPDYSAVTDVYVLMFLADTVDFIIIVFGFWAFGVRHRGISLEILSRIYMLWILNIMQVSFFLDHPYILLFRNILLQQISPLHYPRTRSQRHFW